MGGMNARLGVAAAFVLAVALAAGAAPGTAAAEEAWRLELADGAVAAIAPPRVQAEGGVRFVQGELEVEAHQAVYDDVERVIAFYGQVRARRPGQVLEGDTARVDLRTGQVSVQEARARFEAEGVEGPVFMEATGMEGDATEIRASGAVLTTCPLPMELAHYRVTVRSLEVRPGKDVAAHHAVFWESGIPLFYWPYLHFSLENPRAGRLVPPEVGYGAREGWYVRSRFPYMGPGATYGYVGIDYFQRLGPGLELYQALYDDGDTWAAIWMGGTLRGPDGSPPDLRAGAEGELVAGDGRLSWRAEGARRASGQGLLYHGEATLAGSIPQWGLSIASRGQGTLPAEGQGGPLQGATTGKLQLETPGEGPWRLSVAGRWDLYSAPPGQVPGDAWDMAATLARRLGEAQVALSASHTTHPDRFDDPAAATEWRSVTALPELSARLPLGAWGGEGGVRLEAEASVGRYEEVRPAEGDASLDEAVADGRAMGALRLQAGPARLGAWQLEARGALSGAAYLGGDRRVSVTTSASARWPAGRSAYLQGVYRLEVPLGSGRSPFVFDQVDDEETLTLTGVAGEGRPLRASLSATYDLVLQRWGLATGSLRARGHGLEGSLSAGYRIAEARWEAIVGRLAWTSGLGRAEVIGRYRPEMDAFDEVGAAVAWEATDRAGLRLGARYDPLEDRLERADVSAHLRVLPRWVLVGEGAWDLRLGGLVSAQVGVALDDDCRAILLRYDPVHRQVALAYQVKAFPATMVALGQDRPGSLADEAQWQALVERLQRPVTP